MSIREKTDVVKTDRLRRDRRIIINDIKRGFYSNRYRYALVVMIVILLLVVMGNNEFGFLDTIFFLQSGYGLIVLLKDGKIVFPVVWLMMQFLVPFLIYNYCNDDIENIGVDFLIKCEDRALWWRSKCIWNMITVLSMNVIVYIIAFIYGLYNNGDAFTINYELFNAISNKPLPYDETSIYIIIYVVFVPVMVSASLALVQMTVSMCTSPMIGIIVVMAWNVLSVFINTIPMIGNVAMVVRSDVYNPGGLSVWRGIWFCIALYIVSYITGRELFKRRDILQREEE